MFMIHQFVADEHKVERFQPEAQCNSKPVLIMKLSRSAITMNIEASSVSTASAPPPSAYFWPDPDLQVVVGSCNIDCSWSDLDKGVMPATCHGVIMMIPCRTFQKYIEHADKLDTQDTPLIVDWQEWGPQGSLILNHPRQHPDSYGMHFQPFGSQLVIIQAEEEGDRLQVLWIDTNPWAMAQGPRPGQMYSCHEKMDLEDMSGSQCKCDHTELETSLSRVIYHGPLLLDAPAGHESVIDVATHQSGLVITVSGPPCQMIVTIVNLILD